jgi:hypothetical protein
MRKGWLIVAVVLVFVGTLVTRLPASWLMPLLPSQVQCANPEGSLWSGRCSELTVLQFHAGDTSWQLAPLPLLTGRVVLQIATAGPDLNGTGAVSVGSGGNIDAHDIKADFALAAMHLPLPAGWSGRATLNLQHAQLVKLQLQSLAGTLQVLDLRQDRPELPLGDYELSFPEQGANNGGGFIGQLRDLQGPLSVNATLGVKPDLAWQIDGLVGARGELPDDLRQVLQLMGEPDGSGRYSLSASGTL